MNITFTPRERLHQFEWDSQTQQWDRPVLDRATIKELSERSTWNGLFRVGRFVLILTEARLKASGTSPNTSDACRT